MEGVRRTTRNPHSGNVFQLLPRLSEKLAPFFTNLRRAILGRPTRQKCWQCRLHNGVFAFHNMCFIHCPFRLWPVRWQSSLSVIVPGRSISNKESHSGIILVKGWNFWRYAESRYHVKTEWISKINAVTNSLL